MLVSWLHVAALIVYLGSLLALWIVHLPALAKIADAREQARLLAQKLRLYNPLQTATLGVLVLSGAFRLTELKAAYRDQFAKALGAILAVKLTLAFFLIILGVHQTMGVGLPFVRRYDAGEAVSAEDVAAVKRRLRLTMPALLVLALLTAYMGLKMRGF
ncbi:MAG TPA: hypothetical protein VNL14_14880 [Candidatus Acidoferrales bacterium]|nr:hypothetical protein [Candidatus Acidoferrales bacterium]